MVARDIPLNQVMANPISPLFTLARYLSLSLPPPLSLYLPLSLSLSLSVHLRVGDFMRI